MELFKNIIFFFKTTWYKIKWYFIRRKSEKRRKIMLSKIPNYFKELAKDMHNLGIQTEHAANAMKQFNDEYEKYKQKDCCKQTKK